MSRDETYQPRNYRKQHSDGITDVWEIGGILSFYGEEYTGSNLRFLARRVAQVVITNQSTGSTVLSDYGGSSPIVLPSEYGLIMISATATMTNGSCRMYSAQVGQEVIIMLTSATCSVQSLIIYFSGMASGIAGAGCRGSALTPLSNISLRASSNSMPWVHLRAVEDGNWAVIGIDGDVTESLSA